MKQEEIERMTLHERIQTMEQLWESLMHNQENLESPSWHHDLLEERRKRIEAGEARFLSLDDLKKLKSA